MANQKRSWNYRAEDSTYDLSIADIPIILPGVYRGFDMTLDGTMDLKLTHQSTGYVVTDIAGGTVSAKRGAVVSKQGVVITEDDAETLPIAVGHATLDRIDLIIVEHKFIEVAGGQAAIYSVVQGTPGSPLPPGLPNTALQVIIGSIFIPATTTALTDTGVLYQRTPIPVISGIANNVALKDAANTFEENNTFKGNTTFEKSVGLAYGGAIDITLTPNPDDNPALDIAIATDGNFYKVGDPNTYGELHFIKSNDVGTAIPIVIECRKAFTIKHNQVATAAEGALGYKKIFNQGGADVNLVVGDFIYLTEYLGIWNVTGIHRKGGAVDPTQVQDAPITTIDSQCLNFPDNALVTILNSMIETICSGIVKNEHGFQGESFDGQPFTTNTANDLHLLKFDDAAQGGFDSGSNWFTREYITPETGIAPVFILENLTLENTDALNTDVAVKITRNGVEEVATANVTILAGATVTLPTIMSPGTTLTQGDIIKVEAKTNTAVQTLEVRAGRFSNKF